MSRMDRRAFIGISGAAGLMPLAGVAQGAERVGQPYIELRKFVFETEAQRAAFDEMMGGSGIAAFNRMGINPVGVFCDEKSFSPVHLLLPHPNAESALNLVANLLADSAYAQKAAPFIDAPKAALPYKEVEAWLLRAFQKMSRVERPATTPGRIFQLRIYESPSIQTAAKKVEMFEKAGEMEIFREVGLAPVFFGQTLFGSKMPNLTYMLGFESEDAMKAAWGRFREHPGWLKLKAMPEYADSRIIRTINNTVVRPAAYSQI
ncbi:MAG TPA: NIPSNAP family protein [Verrucomicrobiae bacterium]|nr:NIPSNAP family protein [Verrucomicrobiae bacterium]